MKPYLLALGLALAGNAKADEPKECIEEIVVDVRIAPEFAKDKSKIHEVLTATQEFYAQKVGLPVVLNPNSMSDGQTETVKVLFTRPEIFVQKNWMTYDDYAMYMRRNKASDEVDALEKQWQDLNPEQKQEARTQLLSERVRDVMSEFVYGITDISQREIYLFPRVVFPLGMGAKMNVYMFRPGLEYQDIDLNTKTLEHELGHILLGPYHEKLRHLPDGHDNMMAGGTADGPRPLAFTEEDKAKILSQVCKPEETK